MTYPNKYEGQGLKVRDSTLVRAMPLNGHKESTELRFPILYIAGVDFGDSVVPNQGSTTMQSYPVLTRNNGARARILMPVKTPEGEVVLGDIGADFYTGPYEISDLAGKSTKRTLTNYREVDAAAGSISKTLNPSTVVLNTDQAVAESLSSSLLGSYGLLRTLVHGRRADATPLDDLDYTVERAYSVMRQIADGENAIRKENPEYKSHGLFMVVGNGELERNLATGLSRNYFDGLDINIGDKDAKSHIENLEARDGAIIVNKQGDFVMSGAWITPHYHLTHNFYRKLGIDVSDEGVCDLNQIKAYMGVSGRDVGTKHMSAHAITLCAPDTVAFVLSGESGILRLIKNGRVVRQHPPNFELSYQPEALKLEEASTIGLEREPAF